MKNIFNLTQYCFYFNFPVMFEPYYKDNKSVHNIVIKGVHLKDEFEMGVPLVEDVIEKVEKLFPDYELKHKWDNIAGTKAQLIFEVK